MNTCQLYQIVKRKKNSNFIIKSLRKILFFLDKPFYREILKVGDLTKTYNSETKKSLNQFDKRLQEFSYIQLSEFKDFDAISNRLSFIERNLQKYDAEIFKINNHLGPTAQLSLNYEVNTVELPNTSLVINHGLFGNFLLRKTDVVGDSIRSREFWDKHLHDLIIRYSDMDGIAVDAGAYVGFHSCFMAKYFSKVISFEPQQVIYRMLAANLVMNNVENVEIYNAALYDKECHMKIAGQDKQEIVIPKNKDRIDYANLGNAAALTLEIATEGEELIKAYTIDQLELDKVKFIKIDTQGSDINVLLGARETITKYRPVIVFEYEISLSSHHGYAKVDIDKFFRELDYSLLLMRSHEEKQFDFLAIPN